MTAQPRTREEVAGIILKLASGYFSAGDISEQMRWKDIGWTNDSLDETDFLLSVESRLGFPLRDHPAPLASFYNPERPISDFITLIHSQLTNPSQPPTSKDRP